MLKVLIVDDEILFRTNLKLMIPWEEHGYYLCRDAENGYAALDIIEGEQPDIVITDIRMPVMDGIQLSHEICSKFPDTKLIVLSSYDDYEYVRSSLKSGAIDYILKHRLDKSTLLEALRRSGNFIDQAKERHEGKKVVDITNLNNLMAIKEKFIIQLITVFYNNEEEISEHIKVLGVKLDTKNVAAVVMIIDDYKKRILAGDLKDESLLEFAVVNIAQELLDDFDNGIICNIKNGKFIILLSFSHIRSSAAIDSLLNNILGRIGSCLSKFAKLSVSFSVGEICDRIEDLSRSYKSAEKLLNERFFANKGCILKNNGFTEKVDSFKGVEMEAEKEIVLLIRLKDITGIRTKLEQVFEGIKRQNLSYTSSQIIINDLIGIITRVCKDKAINFSEVYLNNEAPNIFLSRMETLDEIKQWILLLFENLLAHDSEPNGIEPQSEYIIKTINYLKNHYTENISLTDAAESIHITSKYLSTLFLEEMKVTFTDYLCDMRLKKAKALLLSGKTNFKEVASLCGFNNYTYFFAVFKKRLGVTPKEFIKKECL